ncbi:FliM/FliN family flagellar motor switch protein [Parvularcula oceani]|uniref:FliM/FliN family flagellar motor switch protein n=1 Tax=Parvularcula oceani TaxID=1247963 RepID=UPI0004E2825D|nr:FliM/FliN family flagellar motor switch protein [Parvularcula oceani]
MSMTSPDAELPDAGTTGTPLRRALHDVNVDVTVVLGHVEVSLKALSEWDSETVVALDAAADAPLELHANGVKVATAELCEGDGGPGSLAVRILDVEDEAL